MSTDVIRYNILLDTVSWSAQQFFNYIVSNDLNPNGFTDPSQIPLYVYTCLADLCSGFSGGNFSKLVVADYGLSETKTGLGIILQPSESIESVDSGYLDNDQIGAEYSEIDILVMNVKTSKDIDLTTEIGFRLRYILDHKFRALQSNQYCIANGINSTDLIISGSPSINPAGVFKMTWKRSDIPRVSQQVHRFCVEYVRNFAQD